MATERLKEYPWPEFDLVVTRNDAWIDFLEEIDAISDQTEWIRNARLDDVKGLHVIGTLPLRLVAATASFTTIPVYPPPNKNNSRLSLEDIRIYAGEPRHYVVELTKLGAVKHWTADNVPVLKDEA